ncbi:MAG TPA: GNAT family N-acetyltransferase [Candidatus Cybelea sp.]|nr:GNAT family N-acetyltransferase [Candidatus Cybelea sp.]
MTIRAMQKNDAEIWSAMRGRLWPDADARELIAESRTFLAGEEIALVAAAFVAELNAVPAGFIELSIRAFADGCDSRPVPHVEGWYVEPFARGRGIGRALMEAAAEWSRDRGFAELASDSDLGNDGSLDAHARCGFIETERLVKFRRAL